MLGYCVEKARTFLKLSTTLPLEPTLDDQPGMSDEEFLALVNDNYGAFDAKRFGMPITELLEIQDNTELQKDFPRRYGITFEEYMGRLEEGENMGEAKISGKFI